MQILVVHEIQKGKKRMNCQRMKSQRPECVMAMGVYCLHGAGIAAAVVAAVQLNQVIVGILKGARLNDVTDLLVSTHHTDGISIIQLDSQSLALSIASLTLTMYRRVHASSLAHTIAFHFITHFNVVGFFYVFSPSHRS